MTHGGFLLLRLLCHVQGVALVSRNVCLLPRCVAYTSSLNNTHLPVEGRANDNFPPLLALIWKLEARARRAIGKIHTHPTHRLVLG